MDELKSIMTQMLGLQKQQRKLQLQLQKDQYEQQKKQQELQLHFNTGSFFVSKGAVTLKRLIISTVASIRH